MKKEDFFRRLERELEIDKNKITGNTPLHLTSLNHLSLVSLIDENFGVRVKSHDLKEVDTVDKLITLIGRDKFE
jgi:acyl carrier protein